MRIGRALIPSLFVLVACGAHSAPQPAAHDAAARPSPLAPEERLDQLEQALLGAAEVSTRFHITSKGAYPSDLRGQLWLARGNRARLSAAGRFGDADVTLDLTSDGTTLRGTNGETTFEIPTPVHLNESLVIGMTRMGLLHNLARLSGPLPPDHAEGGVARWVELSGVSDRERRPSGAAAARGLSFAITVSGHRVGDATLFLDSEGAPVLREQRVDFGGSTMRVTERYQAFTVRTRERRPIGLGVWHIVRPYPGGTEEPSRTIWGAFCSGPHGS